MAEIKQEYGTYAAMTVTNLNSLANSQTAGWQSARVDNTSAKADDYEILVEIDLANTAAANDKTIYVYAVPWVYDGSAWHCPDGGNATRPSGSEGTYTLGTTNNIRLLMALNYVTADQVVCGVANLSNAFGSAIPDGWSLVIINYTGAAIAASANVVAYRPITFSVA